MIRLGIVTGLASEARCLNAFSSAGKTQVICAGANSERAERAGRSLIALGCSGLLSFGMAGGLRPDLAPGVLIVPRQVRHLDSDTVSVDAAWRDRLLTILGSDIALDDGDIAGSERLLATPEDKRQSYQRTQATAVDMESLALGKVAQQAGLPFLVLRVIADPADRAPPLWSLNTVDAAGRIRILAAVRALLRHPADLPTALGLARDSRIALAVLRRVAMRAGPLFGF